MIWLVVRMRTVVIGVICCLLLGVVVGILHASLVTETTATTQGNDASIPAVINTMLALRSLAVLNGDTESLAKMYDLSVTIGRWAYEHESRRVQYVRTWAEKRGLKIVEASAEGRIVRSEEREQSIWLYVIQSAGYGYVYLDDDLATVNRFGVGTRHVIELVRQEGTWVIKRDWYTDPLDEDTLIPDVTPANAGGGTPSWATPALVMRALPPLGPTEETLVRPVLASDLQYLAHRGTYQRSAAVEYANTYCGAAMGCGNNRRYNPDYRDYTGLGGDCTNFASQVLGDSKAGALPASRSWYYVKKGWTGAGSTAWVKADAFAHHLTASGMASLLKRGAYHQVAKPTSDEPLGLVAKLEAGDLIAYEEKGRVVHFGVITDRDSKGVPLVNSHTADRYQAPWDLGWDQKTVFWLFHVRD